MQRSWLLVMNLCF
ncbi:hypothetical protein LINPERHAP1_LOCUS20165 [Linum perenne]